jgi:hypothetical protein
MWKDPIVEEVRKSGEKLAKAANFDKRLFVERLRANQRKSRRKVVSFSSRALSSAR